MDSEQTQSPETTSPSTSASVDLPQRWRTFEIVIQVLILMSIVTFSLETLPNLSEAARRVLYFIEVFTVGVFTIEYGLRLLLAKN